jgi:hypothetical protein
MRKTSLLAAMAMMWATPLYATHPLITDDTFTQGKGRFQIELNGELSHDRETSKGFARTVNCSDTAVALSYGLSDRIDLIASVSLQGSRLKENSNVTFDEHDIGDLTMEMKCRILENRNNGLSLAIKPGLSIPSGDERKGFGNGEVSGGVVVMATYESKLCALHANIAYTRNDYRLEDDQATLRNDIWHASLAAVLNVSDKLRAVTNIGIETNSDKSSGTAPTFLIGGLIYGVNDMIDLDLGIKNGLNHTETDTTLMAGLAVRF